MQNIDLHNHSRVSDGLLSPAELVALAASNGVTGLALTDHDDLAGLPEARVAAFQHGLGFVTGVEISVTWNQMTLHILGLAVATSMARPPQIGKFIQQTRHLPRLQGIASRMCNDRYSSRTQNPGKCLTQHRPMMCYSGSC